MNLLGSAVTAIKPRLDDSGTDRLNYYYSTVVIMALSVTITAKQYVGSPLQCWVPAQFTKAWEQYAENYCFVYNTYWVPPEENVPKSVEARIAQQLIYYQWVPFIMALEAAFFYLPVLFWGQMSNKSGLNIENLIKTAQSAETEEGSEREKKVALICGHFENSIRLQMIRRDGATLLTRITKFGKLDGTYISNVYLLTKLFYVINLVVQFLMMNKFLGQNDTWWGARILNDILSGTDWERSGNFPRIAMCDFQVRLLNNLQRYSIQCVLVLNMFNEKIFLFLYWWFVAVGIATTVDTINLAYYSRTMSKKIQFLQRFIKYKANEELLMREFCLEKINSDMIILLSMISGHANEIITTEIMQQLWENHKSNNGFLINDERDNGKLNDFLSEEASSLIYH